MAKLVGQGSSVAASAPSAGSLSEDSQRYPGGPAEFEINPMKEHETDPGPCQGIAAASLPTARALKVIRWAGSEREP
jgi:hypothetical protein